jgi:hypothetical protein
MIFGFNGVRAKESRLVVASLIGKNQLSILGYHVLVGRYPFLGQVFVVDLDPAAALKVAKRVFRMRFVLAPNLKIEPAHRVILPNNL